MYTRNSASKQADNDMYP